MARFRILLLLALGACVDTASTICGDLLCPVGRVCAELPTLSQVACVDPAQQAACAELDEGVPCDLDGAPFGACHDRVCLPIACGTGFTDPGEQCDDGNTATGDGCAADCKSDETCGNGVPDPIAGEQCDDGNWLDHDGCTSRCQAERPAWTEIGTRLIGGRRFAALAFDVARGELVLFGGTEPAVSGNLLAETWVFDGVGWARPETVIHPSARIGATMVYDSARGRLVLFGGHDGLSELSDTWEWDGERWEPIPVEEAPPPRASHVMAYDSVRGRTVVFGGIIAAMPVNDTWEYDGTTWIQTTAGDPISTTLPAPRTGAAMGFDPRRGVAVLFGGANSQGARNDLWEYDAAGWHARMPAVRPSARYLAGMAFDTNRQRMIVFGGADPALPPPGYSAELWEWDGTSWLDRTSALPQPPGHVDAMFATDPRAGRVYMVGGITPTTSVDPALWSYDGAAWRSTTFTSFSQVASPAVAVDARRGRMVLVANGKTFERARAGWVDRAQTGPTTEGRHGIAWDAARGVTVLFGGAETDTTVRDRTWEWDGATWTERVVAMRPAARADHAMVYDDARMRTVVFGGVGADGISLADTWTWSGTEWKREQPATSPSARKRAAMAYDPLRKQVVLFGGDTGTDGGIFLSNDTWVWDGSTWREVAPTTRPPVRLAASMAWDAARRRLVLFGGARSGGALADTWEWDGTDWQRVTVAQAVVPRRDAAIATDPDGGIVVIGGRSGISMFGDTWRLRWDGEGRNESCRDDIDVDGDMLAGCADPDCWATCAPLCPPETTCSTPLPWEDATCAPLESCRISADCTCAPTCGDAYCDPGETIATCAGDCS